MRKKILIADDSALVRRQLSELIETLDFDIDLARNGQEAVDKAIKADYDVITMDINMPVKDGITAVREIMDANPTPILMISSLTTESADITIEALELGAIDYISKPGTMNVGRENNDDILRKVKALSRIPKRRMRILGKRPRIREREPVEPVEHSGEINKIVLIGASTGGPGLIERICQALPRDYPYPVCVVQHMPETFTKSFASRLNCIASLPVAETANNMELLPGHVYVARGGRHLHFSKKVSGKIVLREGLEKNERYFQPSVDEMYESALSVFGGEQILGVILTGIGDDGADGLLAIKKAGGYTIGESEESATVYGMPRAAFERGAVIEQLPFSKIVKAIATFR